ncbi:MAG: hypothetical protein V4555_20445 [Acidobacteriota bacterium]
MNRAILIATLALTLPFAALAQSDKPSDKPAEKPSAEKLAAEKAAIEERAVRNARGRIIYPVGTNCATLPTRSEMYDCGEELAQTRYFHLNNVSAQNDANEILVAVRNIADPSVKVYLVASTETIAVHTFPQELDSIAAIIHELDQPRPTYRLTYTVTESDSGKRIGVSHFSFVVQDGQRTTLKQGSKVPVATGSYNGASAANGIQTQFTYLDVGMNFDATASRSGDKVVLKTKVEQSSIADAVDIASVREPVIRQAVIDCISTITPGKPTVLGGMDVTGSTRHLDIEVLAEPI